MEGRRRQTTTARHGAHPHRPASRYQCKGDMPQGGKNLAGLTVLSSACRELALGSCLPIRQDSGKYILHSDPTDLNLRSQTQIFFGWNGLKVQKGVVETVISWTAATEPKGFLPLGTIGAQLAEYGYNIVPFFFQFL